MVFETRFEFLLFDWLRIKIPNASQKHDFKKHTKNYKLNTLYLYIYIFMINKNNYS